MDSRNKDKSKILLRWLPLIILGLLMVAAYMSGLGDKITLEAFQEHKAELIDFVAQRPLLSALAFITIYAVFVALSLPIATLLTLAGGFLFGRWLGTLYVVIAATLGATVIFLIAKSSIGTTLREKTGDLYKRIEGNMKENAVGYLLFMRLVPLFPFFLVNIVPALFNVSLGVYVLTTFFGILPGSFVYVNLGEQLGTIDSLGDLVSGQTVLAFALLGVFALLPTIYKQIKARKNKSAVAIVFALMFTVSGGFISNVAHADTYESFVSEYDSLLKQNVHSGQKRQGIEYSGVDYDAWQKSKSHKKALKLLLASDPDLMKTRNDKMAYWINAYNFLTIELIIREGEKKSIKNLGSMFQSPWKRYSWKIAGKDYTLDQIEHGILRPMGDARVHFAVNCASLSCPDLRAGAYLPFKLEEQLDEQVRLGLQNKTKIFLDDGNYILVSKIFSWFSGDFNDGDVKGWLSRYIDIDNSKPLKYMKYNWSLNSVNKSINK